MRRGDPYFTISWGSPGPPAQKLQVAHPLLRQPGIGQGHEGLFNQFPSLVLRVLARLSLVQNSDYARHIFGLQHALGVDVSQLPLDPKFGRLHSKNQREALLFVENIAGSHTIPTTAPQIGNILADLPGHPQPAARIPDLEADTFIPSGGQCAKLGGTPGQSSRLAADHVIVGAAGYQELVLEIQVHILAFAKGKAGPVQQLHRSQYPVHRDTPLGQAHYSSASQGVQPVTGVDGLGRAPYPPDAGPVLLIHPARLNITVHQGEVMHQLNPRGGGQCCLEIPRKGLAADQGQQGLKVENRGIVFRYPPLVRPAQVVSKYVVQEALPSGEDFLQLLFQG